MEFDKSGQTLERYLRSYPEYAMQLIDLSQETFRFGVQDESPLSVQDKIRIDSALLRIQSASIKAAADVLAELSVPKLREIAQALDVPRQVITAFRERTVIVGSVPRRFAAKLASLVGSSAEVLLNSLSLPPQTLSRSYKADGKPTKTVRVTFEQLLRDSGMSDKKIALLLTDDAQDGRD
ncbi:hypothetical protein [Nitrosospira sp. Nsp1]|uniref:hypothetical protein n=1 Tax=Nitrosospira sp. Nsp1 TaxID=136547 RepID=UPI00115F8B74|nr:hypothetical protein [Nitrosospira sp. Nsp1]